MRNYLIVVLLYYIAFSPTQSCGECNLFNRMSLSSPDLGPEEHAGDSQSQLPLVIDGKTARMQQIIGPSSLVGFPEQGAFITDMYIRGHCGSSSYWSVTNLQIQLSTSTQMVDRISKVFADNIGSDVVTAFKRSLINIGTGEGPCPSSGDFSQNRLLLDVPFFYKPSRGNLLVDITHSGSEFHTFPFGPEPSFLDATDNPKDAISRIVSVPSTKPVADVVDTLGLTILFTIASPPSICLSVDRDNVVLEWPEFPSTFHLQFADTLNGNDAWKDFPGEVITSQHIRRTIIRSADLIRPTYFRLFWNSPQSEIHDGFRRDVWGRTGTTP